MAGGCHGARLANVPESHPRACCGLLRLPDRWHQLQPGGRHFGPRRFSTADMTSGAWRRESSLSLRRESEPPSEGAGGSWRLPDPLARVVHATGGTGPMSHSSSLTRLPWATGSAVLRLGFFPADADPGRAWQRRATFPGGWVYLGARRAAGVCPRPADHGPRRRMRSGGVGALPSAELGASLHTRRRSRRSAGHGRDRRGRVEPAARRRAVMSAALVDSEAGGLRLLHEHAAATAST